MKIMTRLITFNFNKNYLSVFNDQMNFLNEKDAR